MAILPPHQSILVHLHYHNKNIMNWMDYKSQKFVSHSQGDWEVQDEDMSRLGVWQRLVSHRWHLLAVSLHGGRDK